MKLFASHIGLLFAAVFAMSFALHCIYAMDETPDGFRREMEDDEKHPQPLRERRSVKNNATQDILKRLQDMEKKHNESTKRLKKLEKRIEVLLQPGKSGYSWFLSKYFQERDNQNNGLGFLGMRGPPGRPGQTGPEGAKGEKGQDGKSGVQYVRWGRTTCPSGAEIVYKGRIGGEHYTHIGGGVNYLCLPLNPKYDRYKDGWQSSGYVYGTEYEVNTFNPFKKNLHDHEAPCAVCFAKSRGSMLMMPARNDCPSGWTEEYHGYLMTEYYGHKKQRDFICVDENAESVPGTKASKDGALLYPVQGQCGSLPCGPYVAGREFTCAVCTK
ncbi:uncharacterized protein LOC144649289 isoform X2 [Oculina patagonica]